MYRLIVTLTFDLLTLKVVSSVPILVFLGLSILDLGPMYATDRQTDVRQHHRLMLPPRGGGIVIAAETAACQVRRVIRVAHVPTDCFDNFGPNQRIGCAIFLNDLGHKITCVCPQ